MPNINKARVAELAQHFRHYTYIRDTTTAEIAREARARGHSPVRYRWDLLNAATTSKWTFDLRATDAAIDTAIRSALKQIGTVTDWAVSQPLKR